jgi:hypothetical protein
MHLFPNSSIIIGYFSPNSFTTYSLPSSSFTIGGEIEKLGGFIISGSPFEFIINCSPFALIKT